MIKIKILVLTLAIISSFLVLNPRTFADDILGKSCQQASASSVCQSRNTTKNPAIPVIRSAANLIAVVTGIIAVIMIIIGGLTMATSAGNSENVAEARRRVVHAIIGLVIVALSWTIIRFVTDKFIQ